MALNIRFYVGGHFSGFRIQTKLRERCFSSPKPLTLRHQLYLPQNSNSKHGFSEISFSLAHNKEHLSLLQNGWAGRRGAVFSVRPCMLWASFRSPCRNKTTGILILQAVVGSGFPFASFRGVVSWLGVFELKGPFYPTFTSLRRPSSFSLQHLFSFPRLTLVLATYSPILSFSSDQFCLRKNWPRSSCLVVLIVH